MDKLINLVKSINYLQAILNKLERLNPDGEYSGSILKRRENVKNLINKYEAIKRPK